MSLDDFFDSMEDACVPASYSKNNDGAALFQWSAKGVGFGELYFYVKDGELRCENEMMSKEFIKKMLCKMVDDAIMNDPSKKDKENG